MSNLYSPSTSPGTNLQSSQITIVGGILTALMPEFVSEVDLKLEPSRMFKRNILVMVFKDVGNHDLIVRFDPNGTRSLGKEVLNIFSAYPRDSVSQIWSPLCDNFAGIETIRRTLLPDLKRSGIITFRRKQLSIPGCPVTKS